MKCSDEVSTELFICLLNPFEFETEGDISIVVFLWNFVLNICMMLYIA